MLTSALILGLATTGASAVKTAEALVVAAREFECRWRADGFIGDGVMEEGERNRYLNYHPTLEAHIELMEDRRREMEPDCPPVEDCFRLPPRDTAMANWTRSRKYERWLEYRLPLLGPVEQESVQLLLGETRWRTQVWERIVDAQMEGWTPPCGRRLTLQRLRTQIGRSNYDSDRWPNPLPDYADDGDRGWEDIFTEPYEEP